MANTLFLRLEGALQSWGERSRWVVRDTAPEPTKSGVVGLLGCALGWRADEDLRSLSERIRMGVRCDRPGKMIVDFHTICGGVLSAEGKIKKKAGKPETVISWRGYLADASFLAAVQADDPELIEKLADAVQNPVWPVFLGRKSCPPGKPLFEGTGDFDSLEAALLAAPYQEETAGDAVQVRAVIECMPGKGIRRQDATGSNSLRTFLPRYTEEILLSINLLKGGEDVPVSPET